MQDKVALRRRAQRANFQPPVHHEEGWDLFDAVQRIDLEGIVAKRKKDPYAPSTVWFKVRNPGYGQAEGRGDLFNRRRRS